MLYLALHLGLNALAPIVIYLVGRDINHDILIFVSAITAVLCFHLLNLGKNKAVYSMLINNQKLRFGFIKVILTTTFMWVAGFIIPIQYTPFIFIFSYLAWPGFFGALVMAIATRKASYIIQTVLIGIILGLFYFWSFKDYSYLKTIIGVVGTALTGLSLYLYLRYSKQLNNNGVSSKQILAIRYWLLLLLPLLVIIAKNEFNLINFMTLIKCMGIGLITLVLPLYFGQLCIETFGSEKFSLFMGLTPILTFILQFFTQPTEFSYIVVALLLALAILLPLISTYILGLLKSKELKPA